MQTLANDRFSATLSKSNGAIKQIFLDGQDLLGTGSAYLDCYCTPSGFYTPGSISPSYQLLKGIDSTKTPWGGIVMVIALKKSPYQFNNSQKMIE
jgi:rhamnogalacturonan endolyase